MENEFNQLKSLLNGTWHGEGYAKFPTIEDTAYTEICSYEPDEEIDVLRFEQKTWYKNETPNNGRAVFWDTGFILLKETDILLISAQSGGRVETYRLNEIKDQRFVFDSININNDDKTIRSQRIIHVYNIYLDYELNMATRQATEFQNHLKGRLKKLALHAKEIP